MLDIKILRLLFKEEFRLQASFFNRSYFLTSTLVTMLFTFIMGLSLPMLRRAVALDDLLLAAHWVILFYGLGVGGFALFGDRILERRFGSVSLLLGSGYTLPIRHRRLFLLFYIKDTLYYVFFTILPMLGGLAIASMFVPISISALVYLFISLTLSFLIGISSSVLMFTVMARWGSIPLIVPAVAAGIFLAIKAFTISTVSKGLPSLVFFYSHSMDIIIEILMLLLIFTVISFFTIKESPTPHERRASESYRRTVSMIPGSIRRYSSLLAKDILDLIRSGMIFPVVFTFLMPLIFLFIVTWFIESVMLLDLGFSLLFYGAMVGFFCTLLYSWLSNIDISECYNSLPLSMPHVIRTKLILFFFLDVMVAIPYLVAVGYLRSELELIWISLIIMLTVSVYVGTVVAYLTGLFTNSYLLDARILLMFASAVVPVLVAETLLSFYYPINNNMTILLVFGLGSMLVISSLIFLGKLEDRWSSTMFRIA